MKNQKSLSLFFLWIITIHSLTSCQSVPRSSVNPALEFTDFEINKIQQNGSQSVLFQARSAVWPEVKYQDIKPLSFHPTASSPLRIAILGDTGCRLKENKGQPFYQNCQSKEEWPYPEVVKTIAQEPYDFAIHTGDYHYREQCSDPKKCPQLSRSLGYGWLAWWDDFYQPTQPLFKKSPILFVRGNHEDCQRAFSGWGPLSVLQKKFEDSCQEIEPYQWIEIEDLVLINFDDSAFDDRSAWSELDQKKWLSILSELADRARSLNGKKEIWFLAHKPVFGFVPSREDAEPQVINENLKKLMIQSKLVKEIDYFQSGHIHNQQVARDPQGPLQVIVGHTGTSLDPFGRKILTDQIVTTTESKSSFGYAIFERIGFKKWNWIFKNQQGRPELICQVQAQKTQCDFPSALTAEGATSQP